MAKNKQNNNTNLNTYANPNFEKFQYEVAQEIGINLDKLNANTGLTTKNNTVANTGQTANINATNNNENL